MMQAEKEIQSFMKAVELMKHAYKDDMQSLKSMADKYPCSIYHAAYYGIDPIARMMIGK